jgi:hypothetical protein
MKVYIGPYVNWIGPYQIADKIPFLSEDTKDKIGDWISDTWVNDFCNWLHSKKKRKIKIRIDPYDTWSMDNTLALIILPMLKQLKATKQGSQFVDDEDLPPQMRYNDDLVVDKDGKYLEDNGTMWIQHRWDWVLNEMIWAFETSIDEDWEDQFTHGTPSYDWNKWEDDNGVPYQRVQLSQTNPDYWVDTDRITEYNDRMKNGFRLFGKYYRGLWD